MLVNPNPLTSQEDRDAAYRGAAHKPAPGCALCSGTCLRLWRILTFSLIVENMNPPSFHEGDISSLKEVYSNIALMEALLLGMGISPFLTMDAVFSAHGYNAWSYTQNLSIFLQMGIALCNIILIVLLLMYITSVDKRQRQAELQELPVFGLPILNFLLSTIFALSFSISHIMNSLGSGFGWMAVGVVALVVFGGGGFGLYMFFVRLPSESAAFFFIPLY